MVIIPRYHLGKSGIINQKKMDTENKESKLTPRRIAAATIIGTLGSGLVVATVVRLFQVAQEILPWWWPWPLVIGVILFVVALLLLVPLSWWKRFGRGLTNIPRNLGIICWLQSVLRFNKEIIYTTGVKARVTDWYFQTLTNNPLDPYFGFRLELINTSIFIICVSGIEGKAVIDNNMCQKFPTVDKQLGINQGDTFWVDIIQQVSDPMLKRIKDAISQKEKLKFNFSNVFLILETTTKRFEGQRITIKLGDFNIVPS